MPLTGELVTEIAHLLTEGWAHHGSGNDRTHTLTRASATGAHTACVRVLLPRGIEPAYYYWHTDRTGQVLSLPGRTDRVVNTDSLTAAAHGAWKLVVATENPADRAQRMAWLAARRGRKHPEPGVWVAFEYQVRHPDTHVTAHDYCRRVNSRAAVLLPQLRRGLSAARDFLADQGRPVPAPGDR